MKPFIRPMLTIEPRRSALENPAAIPVLKRIASPLSSASQLPKLLTLRDSDEEVRLETILALESLENPAAIPVLKRIAAEDRSEEVREAAAEALDYLVNP